MARMNYLQSAAVSCAIMSSSLVGMTQTVTLESGVEMMAFFAAGLVLLGVDLHTEEAPGRPRRWRRSIDARVLTDTGREDDGSRGLR